MSGPQVELPATDDPTVHRMLSLSTEHLPRWLGEDGLSEVDSVTAWATPYGWLMYVPAHPMEHAKGYHEPIPQVVLDIQLYARRHGCNYVLLDADGAHVEQLPQWDWEAGLRDPGGFYTEEERHTPSISGQDGRQVCAMDGMTWPCAEAKD